MREKWREKERESSMALLHDLSRPDGVDAKEPMPSSFVKSAITQTTPNHLNHHPIKPRNPPSPSSNPLDPIPHNPTPKTHTKPDPQSPNKRQAQIATGIKASHSWAMAILSLFSGWRFFCSLYIYIFLIFDLISFCTLFCCVRRMQHYSLVVWA